MLLIWLIESAIIMILENFPILSSPHKAFEVLTPKSRVFLVISIDISKFDMIMQLSTILLPDSFWEGRRMSFWQMIRCILFLSCLSFCNSVRNFNLLNKLWTVSARALIFRISLSREKTFLCALNNLSGDLDLWVWPLTLLLIIFQQWVPELWYFRYAFFVTICYIFWYYIKFTHIHPTYKIKSISNKVNRRVVIHLTKEEHTPVYMWNETQYVLRAFTYSTFVKYCIQ